MVLSLGQAAKAVRRSKSALSRDVKAGRISASRNADGSLAIEPSELFRVFPPVSHDNSTWRDPQPLSNGAETVERVNNYPPQQATDSLQLYQRLARAEAERDLLLDQVADLRTRLNAEAEERRRLTAVLTDRRELPAAEPLPLAPWPRRVLSWLVKQHV
jgi:hypothetical protein